MNTDKKNQHFVPKFYLRNFSYKDNRKQIGLFNLENERFIPRAKLKTQASKNFFYGKDGKIEDKLANIEASLSIVIRRIVNETWLPTRYSEEHYNLLNFAVLTDLRNPTRLKQIQQLNTEMVKFLSNEKIKETTGEYLPLMSQEKIIEMNIKNYLRIANDIKDLNYKLLINKTSKLFITSDYPVVRYNQFLEQRKHPPSNTGYGSVGLQIFIPLSSRIVLILYDENIYKVGDRKQNTIVLDDEQDVNQLNILQFVNCFSTVYFNHQVDEKYLKYIFNRSKKFDRANNIMFSSGKLVNGKPIVNKTYGAVTDDFIFHNDKDCEIKLNLSKIRIHAKGKKYKMVDSIVQIRKSIKTY